MKKILQVQEVEEEGLISLLGQSVALWCDTYIYLGVLEGVNETVVQLKNPKILYETGHLKTKQNRVAEDLPSPWYIQLTKVESFGLME